VVPWVKGAGVRSNLAKQCRGGAFVLKNVFRDRTNKKVINGTSKATKSRRLSAHQRVGLLKRQDYRKVARERTGRLNGYLAFYYSGKSPKISTKFANQKGGSSYIGKMNSPSLTGGGGVKKSRIRKLKCVVTEGKKDPRPTKKKQKGGGGRKRWNLYQ